MSPLLGVAAEDPVLIQTRLEIGKNNFSQAELALRGYMQTHDQSSYASYLMGLALAGEGRRAESDEYLARALKLNANLSIAWRRLAMNAFEAHDFDHAKHYLGLFLQKGPNDQLANVIAGQIALSQGDCALAVAHFDRSTSVVSHGPQLQLLFAQALLCSGHGQRAGALLSGIHSKDPTILFQAGVLLARAGRLKEALEALEEAGKGYPDQPAVKFNIALVHFQMQQYAATISVLTGMIGGGARDADVYSLLGDSYRHLGQLREALGAFETAESLAPGELQPAVDLLGLYIDLNDTQRGLPFADTALKQHPEAYELFALRAALLSLSYNSALAEADYRKAIQLSPTTGWLYTSLASLLMFDEHRPKDAQDLLHSHLRDCGDYYCYFLYARALKMAGMDSDRAMQAKAVECLKRSIRLNPAFAPARDSLGALYQARGEWAEALLEYQIATQLDPTDSRAYYHLYQLYARTGAPAKARQMLALATKLNVAERTQRAVAVPRDNADALARQAVLRGNETIERQTSTRP
jgi:tetratricopeptide (TPR) repeat protein